MKKDIEWLKEEIERLINNYESFPGKTDWNHGYIMALYDYKGLIDQLDEPEITEQQISDWLYERNVVVVDRLDYEALTQYEPEVTEDQAWNKIAECYPAERVGLQNAFEYLYYGGFMTDAVVEKPVIPKFVADWIEECKGKGITLALAYDAFSKMDDWLYNEEADNKNIELFARAWLDGHTVEKEQKYVVKLPMSKNNDNQYAIVDYSGDIWIDALPSRYNLTEDEIRGLTKGDILFEHFAVKVEEREAE